MKKGRTFFLWHFLFYLVGCAFPGLQKAAFQRLFVKIFFRIVWALPKIFKSFFEAFLGAL
jgi:hypothetical protein